MRHKASDALELLLVLFGMLIFFALFARACAPDVNPTPAPTATATVVSPTATKRAPTVTATLKPTSTSVPTLLPTATATEKPTVRPTFTATALPTPTATSVPATPTAERKERPCKVYVTAAELARLGRGFATDCKIIVIEGR